MARVRYLSRERRLGSADEQRDRTGVCDHEIDGDLLDALPVELRDGDVLAVAHARALGKFHQRERAAAFLAGRGVRVSVAGSDPIDLATAYGRARLHELGKAPTGHGTKKQAGNPGAPQRFKRAEGDQLEMVRRWWAGPLHVDEVRELYADMMRCPKPSRPWLISGDGLGLGKRPKHPERVRRKRSDAGTKRNQ